MIDCTTTVSLDNVDGSLTEASPGCWDDVSIFPVVTWKMRYRARHWEDHYIVDRYFVGDRYASMDPKDDRFGGEALGVKDDENREHYCIPAAATVTIDASLGRA